jgi:hypothetical protein
MTRDEAGTRVVLQMADSISNRAPSYWGTRGLLRSSRHGAAAESARAAAESAHAQAGDLRMRSTSPFLFFPSYHTARIWTMRALGRSSQETISRIEGRAMKGWAAHGRFRGGPGAIVNVVNDCLRDTRRSADAASFVAPSAIQWL